MEQSIILNVSMMKNPSHLILINSSFPLGITRLIIYLSEYYRITKTRRYSSLGYYIYHQMCLIKVRVRNDYKNYTNVPIKQVFCEFFRFFELDTQRKGSPMAIQVRG